MTQPLDREEVQPDDGWRALVRLQINQLVAKDALIKNLEEASAQQQVEIERLNGLLQRAHADADELMYPNTSRDPDWYIRQQGADDMFHRMGDEP